MTDHPLLTSIALQESRPDGISLQGLRLVGSGSASSTGLQLFKPHVLPATEGAAAGLEPSSNGPRSLRGSVRCAGAAAAAAGSGVPIVRAVDVYLAVHVEGMPQQVGTHQTWHNTACCR